MTTNSILERAAKAVAIASDPETAARASIGQEPFVSDEHLAIASAVLKAIHKPTDKMVRAGEAWHLHCSDIDSLWEEMVSAALHPESYPGDDAPFEYADGFYASVLAQENDA
jgi:hypothetical protein